MVPGDALDLDELVLGPRGSATRQASRREYVRDCLAESRRRARDVAAALEVDTDDADLLELAPFFIMQPLVEAERELLKSSIRWPS